MFRLWGKIYTGSHITEDFVIEDGSGDRRTAKVVHAVTALCRRFDLAEPIWLDANIREFQRTSRTRFSQDNFIEEIPFSFFEIQIIEED